MVQQQETSSDLSAVRSGELASFLCRCRPAETVLTDFAAIKSASWIVYSVRRLGDKWYKYEEPFTVVYYEIRSTTEGILIR